MVNFKLGETNVKTKLSACHERGIKKKSEYPTGFAPMTSRAGALTTLSYGELLFDYFTTQCDIDIADLSSMQDACQIRT